MRLAKRISEEVLKDVQSCFVDESNPDKCVDEKLEEHGLGKEDKARVFAKLLKKELG